MNETFEKVLGYMVAHESGNAEEAFFDRAAWRELIVMLRAAHEREMAAAVAERDAEIRRRALLERALKPVMNCETEVNGPSWDWMLSYCRDAVREAQRIMKEGENND